MPSKKRIKINKLIKQINTTMVNGRKFEGFQHRDHRTKKKSKFSDGSEKKKIKLIKQKKYDYKEIISDI